MFYLIKNTALVSIGLLLPAIANAEYVAQRLFCADGPASRVVELLYENQFTTLPCTIREQRAGQPAKVLWQAQHQTNFCADQIINYKNKLSTGGLQCEWVSEVGELLSYDSLVDQRVPSVIATSPAAPDLAETVSWTTTVTTGDLGAAQTASLSREPEAASVQIIELASVTTKESAGGSWPSPSEGVWSDYSPGDSSLLASQENAFVDPDISLDGWVIQVSARTLMNIKTLLINEPEAFEEYLRYEQQNARTIYSKLQLRIHELTQIANSQKILRTGAVVAQ